MLLILTQDGLRPRRLHCGISANLSKIYSYAPALPPLFANATLAYFRIRQVAYSNSRFLLGMK
jgi:hypothetical protein